MIQAVVKVRCDRGRMETVCSFTCGVVWSEGVVVTEDLIGLIGDGERWTG